MPPVPNIDIPASPSASPPAASTKKFANFLDLKKKGVHFNAKLSSSSAIRNPGVLPKMMEFAGIDHYDQYASALPNDVAVPTSYPPWAYGEELNKTQQKLMKRKEAEKRDRIDFVSSSTVRSDARHKRKRSPPR
jgi:HCNGP-like protein